MADGVRVGGIGSTGKQWWKSDFMRW
jgi:hypothetical protein